MHIQFLTRKPDIRKEHDLVQAAIRLGHCVEILDIAQFIISTDIHRLYYNNKPWTPVDIVYPFWAQYDSFIPLILKTMHYYGQRIYKPLDQTLPSKISAAILFREAGLPTPKTYAASAPKTLQNILQSLDLPLILKLSHSSQGVGVFLHKNRARLYAHIEELCAQGIDFVVQECLQPMGQDVRAFVINNSVYTAMQRIAAKGEFRANISLGGRGKITTLSQEESTLVCKATKLFELSTAGVDFIRTSNGPMLLEVNREPGYKGIMAATGLDVAAGVIRDIERVALEKKEP